MIEKKTRVFQALIENQAEWFQFEEIIVCPHKLFFGSVCQVKGGSASYGVKSNEGERTVVDIF